jgi:hypothetical protein
MWADVEEWARNHLVTALLSRTGDTELGWITADRAIAAAQRADDPELIATGMYRLGHVMTRAGRVEEAHTIASSSTPEAISIRGSLALVAAIAAARRDDRREVLAQLRQASQLADELREDRNDHWTTFGPSNVRIHANRAPGQNRVARARRARVRATRRRSAGGSSDVQHNQQVRGWRERQPRTRSHQRSTGHTVGAPRPGAVGQPFVEQSPCLQPQPCSPRRLRRSRQHAERRSHRAVR